MRILFLLLPFFCFGQRIIDQYNPFPQGCANQYDETDAINPDDPSNTIGNWGLFQYSVGTLTSEASTGSDSPFAFDAFDSTPGAFARIEITKGAGTFPSTGRVQFDFKFQFIAGQTGGGAGTGLVIFVEDMDEGFVTVSNTTGTIGVWVDASIILNVEDDVGEETDTGLITFYGSPNSLVPEHFKITDLTYCFLDE